MDEDEALATTLRADIDPSLALDAPGLWSDTSTAASDTELRIDVVDDDDDADTDDVELHFGGDSTVTHSTQSAPRRRVRALPKSKLTMDRAAGRDTN
jgi:hypothetical protein